MVFKFKFLKFLIQKLLPLFLHMNNIENISVSYQVVYFSRGQICLILPAIVCHFLKIVQNIGIDSDSLV